MLTFFDTNVVAYMFDSSSPRKQEIAQRLFEDQAAAGMATISTQVLKETFVTLTRKFDEPLSFDEAEEVIRDLSELRMVQTDPQMILAAITRCRSASLSLWDSLIIEAALAGGCTRLATEDLQNEQVFDSLVVFNPFS
ncbi:MAG: PIN domain-containing protein [bacterium]|nr:PIN domain-containing protein [bacterium]